MTIPWFVPSFDPDDIDMINEIMRSTFVNQGPKNAEFEEILRDYFDVNYAVLTPNGTSALALSLMAAGIGSGDSVIVPDLTFIGTASAVRLAGAEVILADVKKDDFTIDPDDVRKRITSTTRAIIPVHLTGRSADMTSLNAIAAEYDLVIIEDAAEAIGSKNEYGYLGTQSVAGCFSLAPTKIITCGQGGFTLTNEKEMYEQIVRLKDHGRLSRASDIHPVTGFNFKLTDLQAGLAISQFRKLDERMRHVLELDALYRKELADVEQIHFPDRQNHEGSYLMWPDFTCTLRDKLCASLRDEGITLRPFWPPIHTQPAYKDVSAFPGAEYACTNACWLPSSPSLSLDNITTITNAIRNYFKR